MDTNSFLQLVQALQQAQGGGHQWLTPTLLTAAVGALMALAALMQARTAAIKATLSEANTKASKETADKTSDEVEKIHIAVNSRDTAMQQDLQKLRAEILMLTGRNKTLEEHQRGQMVAEARLQGASAAKPSEPVATVEIVAPASAGGGSLSDEQLAQWIQTLQAEQASRTKQS